MFRLDKRLHVSYVVDDDEPVRSFVVTFANVAENIHTIPLTTQTTATLPFNAPIS